MGVIEEIGSGWNGSVVVVISEFGRPFREDGNHGTDHEHGSVYWVLGGGIQHHFQNRDYPVLTDYRSLLGGLFERMYGLEAIISERLSVGSVPRPQSALTSQY